MLPSWVNDTNTLVGLITGFPIIAGWLLSLIGRVISPPLASPTPIGQYSRQRQRVTALGSIRLGISNAIIRPDIPVSSDALRVFLGTILLFGDSLFFFLNRDVYHSALPIVVPLRQLTFYAIFLFGALVTLLWARLFLKLNYVNRHGVAP